MSAKRIAIPSHGAGRQRGAALMVMLVILIIGAAAILVNTLNSSTLQIARDNTTADALAQAKAALIGYATSDSNRPGELPCPDFDNDGMSTPTNDYSGSNCKSLVGWLPWKTLGIPELLDGNGNRLWYAVSDNFHANGTATLNSDTQGTLNITGTSTASNIIAIVFAPENALSGQNRAACNVSGNTIGASLCASHYLEGSNPTLSTAASPNTAYQTASPSSTFNDQMITISHDQLFAPVETRIAREAKKCLDDYAATVVAPNTTPGRKYPWAAPVTDLTYSGTYTTLFGRISSTPNRDTTSDGPGSSAAITLSAALSALQAAVNAFNAIDSGANYTALYYAANTVISLKYSVSGISGSVDRAGDYAKYFANDSVSYSTATYYITSAVNALANHNSTSVDSTMSASWPTGCFVSGSYWDNWGNMVFYQVADGFRPNGNESCSGNCLSITGSGNTASGSGTYRATVLVARNALNPTQTSGRASPNANPPSAYLEGLNPHSGATPPTTFETYNPSDASYSTVNDLVLCVDGKNNCI